MIRTLIGCFAATTAVAFGLVAQAQSPAGSTVKPPTNMTITCDVWSGAKYTSDPHIGSWSRFNSKATLVAYFDEKGQASVTLPEDAFPAGTFPARGKDEQRLNTYSGETIAYRLISKELIDIANFAGVDSDQPKVTWERIRLSGEGPKDTLVQGVCRKDPTL